MANDVYQSQVIINQQLIDEIAIVLANKGAIGFFSDVKNRVPRYAPSDTMSMINNNYITAIDEEAYALCYGSKSGDDNVNIVAIVQHESDLNHFGLPGRSMREDVEGASIPGLPWAIGGVTVPRDISQKAQKARYQKGYRAKKLSGQLRPYASKYLLYAVEDEAVNAIKHYKGIDFTKLKSARPIFGGR